MSDKGLTLFDRDEWEKTSQSNFSLKSMTICKLISDKMESRICEDWFLFSNDLNQHGACRGEELFKQIENRALVLFEELQDNTPIKFIFKISGEGKMGEKYRELLINATTGLVPLYFQDKYGFGEITGNNLLIVGKFEKTKFVIDVTLNRPIAFSNLNDLSKNVTSFIEWLSDSENKYKNLASLFFVRETCLISPVVDHRPILWTGDHIVLKGPKERNIETFFLSTAHWFGFNDDVMILQNDLEKKRKLIVEDKTTSKQSKIEVVDILDEEISSDETELSDSDDYCENSFFKNTTTPFDFFGGKDVDDEPLILKKKETGTKKVSDNISFDFFGWKEDDEALILKKKETGIKKTKKDDVEPYFDFTSYPKQSNPNAIIKFPIYIQDKHLNIKFHFPKHPLPAFGLSGNMEIRSETLQYNPKDHQSLAQAKHFIETHSGITVSFFFRKLSPETKSLLSRIMYTLEDRAKDIWHYNVKNYNGTYLIWNAVKRIYNVIDINMSSSIRTDIHSKMLLYFALQENNLMFLEMFNLMKLGVLNKKMIDKIKLENEITATWAKNTEYLVPLPDGSCLDFETCRARQSKKEDGFVYSSNLNLNFDLLNELADAIETKDPKVLQPVLTNFNEYCKDALAWGAQILPELGSQLYGWVSFAYYLSGSKHMKQMGFWFGEADRGKTKTLEILARLFGDLAQKLPTSTFNKRHNQTSLNVEVVTMNFRRMYWIGDITNEVCWNQNLMKDIVAESTIMARNIFELQKQIVLDGKLVVASNHEMNIDLTDDSVTRKVRYWEFPIEFVRENPGPNQILSDPYFLKRLLGQSKPEDDLLTQLSMVIAAAGYLLTHKYNDLDKIVPERFLLKKAQAVDNKNSFAHWCKDNLIKGKPGEQTKKEWQISNDTVFKKYEEWFAALPKPHNFKKQSNKQIGTYLAHEFGLTRLERQYCNGVKSYHYGPAKIRTFDVSYLKPQDYDMFDDDFTPVDYNLMRSQFEFKVDHFF